MSTSSYSPILAFLVLLLSSFRNVYSAVVHQATETCVLPEAEEGNEKQRGTMDYSTKYYGVTASTITGCLELEKNVRPLYNSTIFERLREVYRKVRKSHPNDMGPISEAEAAYTDAGTVVPFVVQMIPGTHYRGIFSIEDVPKGTVLWRPGFFGTFLTEAAWLDFLDGVLLLEVYGKELACDSLQWSYALEGGRWNEETGVWDFDDEEFMVALDLDESSFTNHDGTAANVGDDDEVEDMGITPLIPGYSGPCDSCLYNTYALRDIKAGEEMKVDYTKFYEFGKIGWFEASVAKAWDVDRSLRTENQWHYR